MATVSPVPGSAPGRRAAAGRGPAVRALLALRGLAYPLIRRLRGHPLAVRALFGVRLPPGLRVGYDTTTVALHRSLARRGRGAASALEVGVGEAALLAVSFARRFGVAVDGVDLSAARVESSRRVAGHNRAAVRIWQSDLLDGVEGRYDLIFTNPPYVPTAAGRALDLTAAAGFDDDRVWDGGADGTAVIARLLAQAPAHLEAGGRLILGVQSFYVPDETVRRLAAAAGFEVVGRERPWLSPSVVWVLAPGPRP